MSKYIYPLDDRLQTVIHGDDVIVIIDNDAEEIGGIRYALNRESSYTFTIAEYDDEEKMLKNFREVSTKLTGAIFESDWSRTKQSFIPNGLLSISCDLFDVLNAVYVKRENFLVRES